MQKEKKKMTNYRIQLASNFQVVEFNLEIDDDEILSIDDERISDAVNVVNKLGEVVINTIKSKDNKTTVTTEEMATEKQIALMKKLKVSNPEQYTKQRAREIIKDLTTTS